MFQAKHTDDSFLDNLVLYVKSKKISVGESFFSIDHHGDYYGALGTTQTIVNYPPEDQEAIDLLAQAKIIYKLVDLTYCPFTTRLKAIVAGTKTPTLKTNDTKIVGVENIRKALKDLKQSQ